MMHRKLIAVVVATVLVLTLATFASATEYQVGVAAIDITPDYPIRLNGFGFRRTESEGVTAKIYAKAIAIDDGGGGEKGGGPVVMVTVDNLGVPAYITSEVADRLQKKVKLDPKRFTITSTHTHTGPMLRNCCPTIFGSPLPPDQQAHVDRYTKELTDKIEAVALDALQHRTPAKIEWGIGEANFSINRRTKGGPVDHDLPVLVVRDPASGKLRAVYVSYACHCVTLSNNKISGDWAGYVQELIAKNHPDAMCLTSVGCGGDSNPGSGVTGDKVDIAISQGKEIAAEVDRMITQRALTPLDGPLNTQLNRITLPFDTLPTREQWEATAKRQDTEGYHARVNLARLDRGEKLPTEIPYTVQTWTFGDRLAMVFLSGEVVVDYSLRLKHEFDRSRLWINAYSNDVPCYIPSERVLKEGGYEGGGAMIYYDKPTRLAPGLEQKIVDEVHRQVPEKFATTQGTEGVAARSPEHSLHSIRTKPDLKVELVASEPLITSPVAIDWDERGRMWVCEMFDYPTGADQNWQPGGRIRVLESTHHDGHFDKSTVFLEKIPFPTGVMAWGKGVLVCSAPDILYCEDTDNDGKADKIVKLFTGFETGNYQARVNGLCLGLDNWIYGANGLLGGDISRPGDNAASLNIRNHDFRFRPLNGPLETVAGLTQQGRVRDDFGRWFGCDNSSALLYYPREQRYLVRNPHVPSPALSTQPPGVTDYDITKVYPVSRTLERFNDPNSAGHITSGCGIGIYRDTLLGEQYANDAFTCEPVHNLVTRMKLTGVGSSLKRSRAADETDSEFFASTDNWTRPVQARTGPDGAIYFVDMYRFLIEHPRWIPAERLSKINIRAGSDMGRIYRVVPATQPLRPVPDLTKLSTPELAAALNSPNGTERDRVQVALLNRPDAKDANVQAALESLATTPLPVNRERRGEGSEQKTSDADRSREPGNPHPTSPGVPGEGQDAAAAAAAAVRVQALSALDGVGLLQPATLEKSLADPDEHVRAFALRLMEPAPTDAMLKLADDPSPFVRRQLAYSLGEWDDPRAGRTLAQMATASFDDAELRIAILSSATKHCGQILSAVMHADAASPARQSWIAPLVATAAASSDEKLIAQALAAVLPPADAKPGPANFAALANLLDAKPTLRDADPAVAKTIAAARATAADPSADEPAREAAFSLLGRGESSPDELDLLADTIAAGASDKLRSAAFTALRRQSSADVATKLISRWPQTPPVVRPDIVSFLIGRDEWATTLLNAIKKRTIQPNEIALADRQKLTGSANESIHQLAAAVFADAPISKSRAEVIERYANVKNLTGVASSGKDLFAKNCSACHLVNGVGHEIGPNLVALRGRDPDYFVKNILDPSAVIEPRFVNYIIKTKDGRTLSGVIKAETPDSITLASGGGGSSTAIETLPRAQVKDIKATSISMMPEGFEAALAPQQLADVIAFLRSGAPKAKQLPGNTPQTIAADAEGAIYLPASEAEIAGAGPIAFESEFANIGYWQSRDDQAAWSFTTAKAGDYDVYFDYACAADSNGNAFGLEAGTAQLKGVIASTGDDWSEYKQTKIGTIHVESGPQRLTLHPDADLHGALLDLRTIALVPAGTKPKHWPARSAAQAAADDNTHFLGDAPSIARFVLDESHTTAARESAITANPQFAPDLIAEMTRDLPADDTKQEYARIPWLWRISLNCGRRNDPAQLRQLLEVALPAEDQTALKDWQAVVLGGGIVNGISQRDAAPADRITELLGDDAALHQRWTRALALASSMADNEKIPTGTRYDAIRLLGAQPWPKSAAQLTHYLAKDTNAELQMAAVSAAADTHSPDAFAALKKALPDLTVENRKLAEERLKQKQ